MKDSGLRNKVVIVTGGTGGIGRATAIRFAQEGARVAIWDMSDAASEAVLGELKSAGASRLALSQSQCDRGRLGAGGCRRSHVALGQYLCVGK